MTDFILYGVVGLEVSVVKSASSLLKWPRCATRYAYVSTLFLAATKRLYEWYFPSVCTSVRPSVLHTFLTMFPSSYHHEIFRSYYQWQKWRPCQKSRSKVKVTEVKKIVKFDPDWPFPDCNSSLNSPMATTWWTKLEVSWRRCPIVFQGHPLNCKVTRL